MRTPRLRMIAGPNGSGKSTLLEYLRTKTSIPLGHCQNPDEVEEEIRRTGELALRGLGCKFEEALLREFLRSHPLSKPAWGKGIAVNKNKLTVKSSLFGGYLAAVLCDFIRREWIAARRTFTFETVMSSADKIELLKTARASGYRNYLYYICTDSAKISVARVAARVSLGGHDVQQKKVEQRYLRSLNLLPAAIALSNRAYLFDNSERSHKVVAEYENGTLVRVTKEPPLWFAKYVLNTTMR
jgi:predicted ABC-type ATPase